MATKKFLRPGAVAPHSKNKEIIFLTKFKQRFKTNSEFINAVRDMKDEGLIKYSSYLAMKKKYPVKNNRTKAVKKGNRPVRYLDKESKKHKEKTPSSGCEGPSSWRNC